MSYEKRREDESVFEYNARIKLANSKARLAEARAHVAAARVYADGFNDKILNHLCSAIDLLAVELEARNEPGPRG